MATKSFAHDFNDFYVNHYLKKISTVLWSERKVALNAKWFKASVKVHLALIQQQHSIDSNDINFIPRKCFTRSRFAAIHFPLHLSFDDLFHHFNIYYYLYIGHSHLITIAEFQKKNISFVGELGWNVKTPKNTQNCQKCIESENLCWC